MLRRLLLVEFWMKSQISAGRRTEEERKGLFTGMRYDRQTVAGDGNDCIACQDASWSGGSRVVRVEGLVVVLVLEYVHYSTTTTSVDEDRRPRALGWLAVLLAMHREITTQAYHDAYCFLIAQPWATGGAVVRGYERVHVEPAPVRSGYLGRPHIGSGSHRSTNISFDYGPNPRRAFWGASAQARGTDDPAALRTVLNVEDVGAVQGALLSRSWACWRRAGGLLGACWGGERGSGVESCLVYRCSRAQGRLPCGLLTRNELGSGDGTSSPCNPVLATLCLDA